MSVWKKVFRRWHGVAGLGILLLPALLALGGWRGAGQGAKQDAKKAPAGDALRLNTLGVAYMNQQKSAEAQKYFEQSLQADPAFAQARMNLGISLLAQQKI